MNDILSWLLFIYILGVIANLMISIKVSNNEYSAVIIDWKEVLSSWWPWIAIIVLLLAELLGDLLKAIREE